MRHRKLNSMIAAGAVLALALAALPVSEAGGTTPTTSGSYSTKYWGTYGVRGQVAEFKARIDKLTSETDGTYDYYIVANYMRQTATPNMMDYPNFWTFAGQPGWTPDEVDWDPGITSTSSTSVSFGVGASASGPSGSVSVSNSFSHQWCGDWSMPTRASQTTSDGYQYFQHQEAFAVGYCWSGEGREQKWDFISHGTAWKVKQSKAVRFYGQEAIAYCDTGFWSCGWSGPDTWDDSTITFLWESSSDSGCLQAGSNLSLLNNLATCVASPSRVLPNAGALKFPAIDQCLAYKTYVRDCNHNSPDSPTSNLSRDLASLT